MSQSQLRPRLDESRFHGTLIAGQHTWHVYFLDVARLDHGWIVECAVVGPRVTNVTIRCRSEVTHGDTARRVMRTLRDWLVSGDRSDGVYLEVPEALDCAS